MAMMMRALGLALIGTVGCGPGTNPGGSGSGDASGSTTGGPTECSVETNATPPHEVTFSFSRASGDPVYLSLACDLIYAIRACADGYSEDLPLSRDCYPSCENPDEPVACPDCALGSQIVAVNAPFEYTWSGITFPVTDGCYDETPMPAAIYRIVIPVYDSVSMFDEPEGPERTVQVDFELPAAGPIAVPVD